MKDKKMKAKITGIKEQFNYKNFMKVNLLEIEAEKHEGGTQKLQWLVFERGHAVGVLGYDPKRDEIVLINEMRPGILAAGEYPYTDNVVAGGIAKGETAIESAVREMKEEANLELKDPVLVHPGAFVSSGGTSEKIAIVVGIVDTSKAGGVHGAVDEHENIKTVVLKSDEFLRRLRASEITDLKTMVAGYWFAENKAMLDLKYKKEEAAKPPLHKFNK